MIDNNHSVQLPSASQAAVQDIELRAKIFAALSDPTRLRIVEMLASCEEMSGSEIANYLGISLALFCHHSKTLAEAGLIQIRKEGQTKYNSLKRELLLDCFASFTPKQLEITPGENNSKEANAIQLKH
ncbi:metalloregulator ArsR/SmtB family transcription factor [Coleofasciculus sp. FACHB-T130]|uniref:ArsR/SmtB family transcription factor n=1 Tax=Cyanophyceae TaxID=3028117 RepID=UPI001686C34B|nr:metalloregulator ArsR/SmtB family transcription factor [Coleofasciculus sp. FACHB-T130]MBD1878407.1 helix-turn-helix transcriptional regulator [Coleofasciculus sp. FACHB-T130]